MFGTYVNSVIMALLWNRSNKLICKALVRMHTEANGNQGDGREDNSWQLLQVAELVDVHPTMLP